MADGGGFVFGLGAGVYIAEVVFEYLDDDVVVVVVGYAVDALQGGGGAIGGKVLQGGVYRLRGLVMRQQGLLLLWRKCEEAVGIGVDFYNHMHAQQAFALLYAIVGVVPLGGAKLDEDSGLAERVGLQLGIGQVLVVVEVDVLDGGAQGFDACADGEECGGVHRIVQPLNLRPGGDFNSRGRCLY